MSDRVNLRKELPPFPRTERHLANWVREQDEKNLPPSTPGAVGAVHKACHHCSSHGRGSRTSENKGAVIGVCEACGMPMCDICNQEEEGCVLRTERGTQPYDQFLTETRMDKTITPAS